MSALPRAKEGRVRVLATTAAKRWYGAPEIPTMAESGLAGYELNSWHAVFVPKGTPRDIVLKINAEIVRGLKARDARERLASFGAEPVATTPEEFDAYLKSEMAKWRKVVQDAGLRAE
jgi:tripartite-type tricarboxylate transporter receptor subunit TctC